ncbi:MULTISPECIES: class I SAM-dependent methyltransferase [unclassified Variovorax]|uniref:class I SAM-dependent methyltransferase n=1 Tax=unclassified Variovorax TaxID=663243 RepID=UPI003ED124CD
MLDFTGERFIPTESGEIRYEHMHRYCWVQSLCSGRDVLDIACGEGYGSALLADVARSVVGVDISHDAVAHASRTYAAHENLRFLQGSATQIPVADACIDVAVSFETLEHLAEQEEMLTELRRVLKPSGILIISSPNKKVYSDDRNYVNEFHVKELYFDELGGLLHRHFPATRYFGQRFLTASALLPIDEPADHYGALLMADDQAKAQTFVSDQSMYFVAICAADENLLPAIGPNIFMENGSDLYTSQQGVMRWASQLDKDHAALSARHVSLQAEFDERSAWALMLRAERDTLEKRLANCLSQEEASEKALAAALASNADVKRQLSAMVNSRSWKVMAPLRWVARMLR